MKLYEPGCDQKDVVGFATVLLKTLARIYNAANDPSGYLTIRSSKDGRMMFMSQIGECPAEKTTMRVRNSMEKGERLFTIPDDVSSWQTRDPENQKYAGAIKTPEYIVSYSGLPELADETLCALVAIRFGWMTKQDADHIFNISINTQGHSAIEMLIK